MCKILNNKELEDDNYFNNLFLNIENFSMKSKKPLNLNETKRPNFNFEEKIENNHNEDSIEFKREIKQNNLVVDTRHTKIQENPNINLANINQLNKSLEINFKSSFDHFSADTGKKEQFAFQNKQDNRSNNNIVEQSSQEKADLNLNEIPFLIENNASLIKEVRELKITNFKLEQDINIRKIKNE